MNNDHFVNERTKMGSSFMTIFDDFVKRVWIYQIELGIILEDTLQCAGRISYQQRQFQNDKIQGCSANLKNEKDAGKANLKNKKHAGKTFCVEGGTRILDSGEMETTVQATT